MNIDPHYLGAIRILRAAHERESGLRSWYIGHLMILRCSGGHQGPWSLEHCGVALGVINRTAARIILRGLLGGCPCCDGYWYPPMEVKDV